MKLNIPHELANAIREAHGASEELMATLLSLESLPEVPATLPMQPVVIVDGIARFQKNRIVEFLLDYGRFDLNHIARMHGNGDFSREEMEQFTQLIGYSIGGAYELEHMSDAVIRAAEAKARELLEESK